MLSRAIKRAFQTKPLDAYLKEEEEEDGAHGLQRNMSLFDLICVGVGGTIGTGVFVLSGLIAKDYAGPSAFLSFLIAGFACLLSAASYGELSSRISSAGSSYAYAYAALGEYPAVIAAFAVSLEYGVSGAAVSRSWGDKVNAWIGSFGVDMSTILDDYGINLFAGALQLFCVLILLAGINAGKVTINVFTVFKIGLVLFMIFGGLALFQTKNLTPFAPNGASGILRGSTSCFFGLLGFDEVCCMAAETKEPHKILPKAVFGTIFIVTILYCLACIALVGMVYYTEINKQSCFPDGFRDAGWLWAAQIVSAGEVICLPLVALISFLAQPRIQYAMAKDGLLPSVFADIDEFGNLSHGIMISGAFCTIIAIFVPFSYLNDVISCGVLFSFNLTNSSLVMIRRGYIANNANSTGNNSSFNYIPTNTTEIREVLSRSNNNKNGNNKNNNNSNGSGNNGNISHHIIIKLCSIFLGFFHIVSILFAICISTVLSNKGDVDAAQVTFSVLLFVVAMVIAFAIDVRCPENSDVDKHYQYRVPFMPYPPLAGILINYVLISQLSGLGLLLSLCYFGIATLHYIFYCLNKNDTASYNDISGSSSYSGNSQSRKYEKCSEEILLPPPQPSSSQTFLLASSISSTGIDDDSSLSNLHHRIKVNINNDNAVDDVDVMNDTSVSPLWQSKDSQSNHSHNNNSNHANNRHQQKQQQLL